MMKSPFRHIPLTLVLSALTVVAPLHVQAQEPGFKAGFVSIDRIFRDASAAKAAQARLEKEFSAREKDLLNQGNTLKTASEKFEREAATLSESQRTTRQRQLVEQDRDFQRKRLDFQDDLAARKSEELNKVVEQANRIVKQVAEAQHYDVILQDAVYINPKHDITDKVIQAMDSAAGGRK